MFQCISERSTQRLVATPSNYMVDSCVEEKAMGWIVSDADHLGGKPRVRDTRISVALLLEWLAAGMTIAEIVKEYPSLTGDSRHVGRISSFRIAGAK
jgi:uncharacterized protein (DUF433 family)